MSYPWLSIGLQYEGMREVPGPGVNAALRDMWAGLPGGPWFWKHYGEDDSKLPWCGAFAALCMKKAGVTLPKRYSSALGWLEWGSPLHTPTEGAVAVFKRAGGGHVGFVVGQDQYGRLLVLGGNQNDSVSVAPFDSGRIVGYRWPPGVPRPAVFTLPTMAHSGAVSRNEA